WSGMPLSSSLREATVHSSLNGSFSIRKGRWKLEMCAGSGGWSYPKPGDEPAGTLPIQLYDLEDDISERQNRIHERPDIVEALRDLLTSYVKRGRSTPGTPQQNSGPLQWPQLNWLAEQSMRDGDVG
ncbi:arylsulfatase, partial [bacterium]|nr:arylsulfatase [bacterium]